MSASWPKAASWKRPRGVAVVTTSRLWRRLNESGKVRTCVVMADVTTANLREAVACMVSPKATLHTDEKSAYKAVALD